VLTLGVLVYLAVGVRRRVLYPLRRPFERDDVALAIERRFPDLHQRLISAHQLHRAAETGSLRDQSETMVRRIVAEAAEHVRRLPLGEVLDPRRTVRVWAAASTVFATAFVIAVLQPVHVGTMLQRALGLSVDYPRLTTLFVELPTEDEDYRIEDRDGETIVTLAAGADLPVLVRAEGVVPREVYLVVEGGRGMAPEVATTRRPGDRFRHVFRQVQSDFAFHARGGDDPNGDRIVLVRTVRPPLVGTIDAELTFPAYTGLPPETRPGGTVEALVGTRVRLAVTTTEAVDQAALAFLDSGQQVALEPIALEDDSGDRRSFAAEFVVTASDRYEVRLQSPDGLRNPKPGTYPVVAVEDHAPVGRVLLPSGEDIHLVVPGAFIPVRVEAKDDFGLASVRLTTRTGRDEVEVVREVLPANGAVPVETAIPTALLSLPELVPGRAEGPQPGETVSLVVTLTDNREPESGTTDLSRRQIHVVSEADLLRRVSGDFRRLREAVEEALDVQRERREILEVLVEDPPPPTSASRDTRLVSVEVGQSRVLSTARRIREGLMRAYDTHLFNRLEGDDTDQTQRIVDFWLRVHAEDPRPEALLPEFYRGVDEQQRSGRIGATAKTLDPILAMTMAADRIVEQHGLRAVEALEAAGIAASDSEVVAKLTEAMASQIAIERELEALLSRLDEWNEFQDVVQQARALRDAQRDIESRTRTIQGGGR
jgi:hypothetical protein